MESYQRYGSISPLWQSSEQHFEEIDRSEKLLSNLHRYSSTDVLSQYRKDVDVCRQRGIEIIRLVDKKYPEQLRNLTETTIGPPLVLFKKGSLPVFERCVAISGTRDCSFYGRNFAMEAAQVLASKKFIIVSGLARGIDEWAHFGALKPKQGKSVAVLPWMEPLYPPEHNELAEDVQKRGGAIVSEHYRQNFGRGARGKFVERNRITSGLSLCVLAIESDAEGGTVHQVELALAQGKRVFALVPKGNERAKRGYELFLKKGAVPMKSIDEVLEYLKDMEHSVREQRIETFYPGPQRQLGKGEIQREDSP
jgi:DNA processing protein